MPRPKLIRSSTLPYHVRSRSNNREWFYIPKEQLWRVFAHVLEKTCEKYSLRVHLFVLLDNHFHMIVSTPKANLGDCMRYLNREVSKSVGTISGRTNRIFGCRYQRSLLDSERYLRNAVKYVCRNPVSAGLSTRVDNYEFSTLPWTLGRRKKLFSLSEEPKWILGEIVSDPKKSLEWLNTDYHPMQKELIRLGLRRQTCRWSSNSRFRNWVTTLD